MRIYKILFLLIVLSSCSTVGRYQSIRMVKVDKKETAVLDKEKSSDPVDNSKKEQSLILAQNEPLQGEISNEPTRSGDAKTAKISFQNKRQEYDDLEPETEDDEENIKIVDQATRAEKNAGAALYFSIAGLFTLILPYIGIFPLIVGIIFHARANNSRYITPFGENRLKISRIILSLDIVFLFLWILLIALLVFVL